MGKQNILMHRNNKGQHKNATDVLNSDRCIAYRFLALRYHAPVIAIKSRVSTSSPYALVCIQFSTRSLSYSQYLTTMTTLRAVYIFFAKNNLKSS